MRTQRGFTLVELLLALVLMGIVTASIFTLLTTTQRVARAQSERASLQSNVRTGAIVVPSELRQLNVVSGGTLAQNDIINMLPDRITYRAMRGMGFLCQAVPNTYNEVRVWASSWTGYRDPAAIRDGAYVFIENNPNKSSDDVWLPIAITGVTAGNVCPTGKPGFKLTVSPVEPGLAAALLETPVRTYEVMELNLYDAPGGDTWLGAHSVSALEVNPQPMLGPLRKGDGLVLQYFDAAGNPTGSKDQVRSIGVTVRGLSDQAITTGTGSRPKVVGDSLVTRVVLRNALR